MPSAAEAAQLRSESEVPMFIFHRYRVHLQCNPRLRLFCGSLHWQQLLLISLDGPSFAAILHMLAVQATVVCFLGAFALETLAIDFVRWHQLHTVT